MLENYDTSLPVDTVNAPSDAGSRAAIEHLIARGCARIGIVGDNHDPNNPNIIPGSRDIRMRAAKETILAAGLPFDERRDFIKSSWVELTAVSRPGAAWPRKASASTTVCTA